MSLSLIALLSCTPDPDTKTETATPCPYPLELYDGECWYMDTCGEHTGLCFYDGTTFLEDVSAGCHGPELVIEGHTRGWTSDARVNLTDSGSPTRWDEEHTLPSVSFGSNGFWDFVEVSLTAGVPQAEWRPGHTSSFDCSEHVEAGLMTYAVRVWDPDGLLADCWTWGHDPSGYIDGRFDVGVNPVTDAHELAACTIVEDTD